MPIETLRTLSFVQINAQVNDSLIALGWAFNNGRRANILINWKEPNTNRVITWMIAALRVAADRREITQTRAEVEEIIRRGQRDYDRLFRDVFYLLPDRARLTMLENLQAELRLKDKAVKQLAVL